MADPHSAAVVQQFLAS